jgi:hypothetical protein
MTGAESQFRITRSFVFRSESGRAPSADSTGIQSRIARSIREFGSYGTIALTFPGGNLITFALWMLQHRTWLAARARRGLSAAWTAAVRLIFPS